MSWVKEFREFAVKGNAVDLAVGVILGAAFGKIITSLVDDVLMPPIGLALGGVDFTNLFVNLGPRAYATLAEAQAAGAPTLNYGRFLQSLIDFLLVAFVVFLLVRTVNRLRRNVPPPPPAATRKCPYCVTDIPLAATRCPQCTSEVAPA